MSMASGTPSIWNSKLATTTLSAASARNATMPVRPSAKFSGSTMLTIGGCVADIATSIVTDTAALVAVPPRSSVARAVKRCTPVVEGVQLTEYGSVVTATPMAVLPSKNCTLLMVPPLSLALAVSVIGVPGLPVLLFAGAVKATVGGALMADPASVKIDRCPL